MKLFKMKRLFILILLMKRLFILIFKAIITIGTIDA
jgi:hypothetical protein